jgi:HEAT repeat protein
MNRFFSLLVVMLILYQGAGVALSQTFTEATPPSVETQDPTLLIQDLVHSDPAVQEAARQSLRQIGVGAISPLITNGLGNADEGIRKNALSILVGLGAASRKPLIKALKDSSVSVRAGAAKGLGLLRDRRAVSPLMGALSDREAIVRQAAFTGLVNIGPSAVDSLVKGLSHPSSSVRRNAPVILAKIGGSAVQPLINEATHSDPAVRIAVFRTLGRIGQAVAIPTLIRGLGETSLPVRAQAVESLVAFGRPVVPKLLATLKGPETALHDGAVDALVGIGKNAVPELVAMMQEPKVDYRIRAKGVAALRRLQWAPRNVVERVWAHIVSGEWEKVPIIPKAIPPLMLSLENPLAQVRTRASEVLVSFRDAAVTPLATEILRQKNPFFLEAAAQTLGNIGIRDFLAVEALTGLLSNNQFLPVQSSVIEALGKVGNYLAVEPLLLVVEDQKRQLRIRVLAVDALRRLGDPRVTMRLISVLKKASVPVFREGIIVALGQLRDPRSAPMLVEILNEDNEAIRKRAEEALLLLRPSPIELLINALGDRRPVVQQSASYLLTQIGEPATEQLIATLREGDAPASIRAKTELLLVKILEALPQNVHVMVKALDAPSNRVRLLAVQSLSQIKSVKAVPHLLAISEQEWHYPPELRMAATSALKDIQVKVDPVDWQGAVDQERRSRLQMFVPLGPVLVRLFAVLAGYWILASFLAICLSRLRFPLGLTHPSYWVFLVGRIARKSDPTADRGAVQRTLRMGFFNWQSALLPSSIIAGILVAPVVWGRAINSIIGTFAIAGSLLCFILWVQSEQGTEQMSRILDYRSRGSRFMMAPMAYLGLILFPGAAAAVSQSRSAAQKSVTSSSDEAASGPEPFTTLAMLLENFSHSERMNLLQSLGEHAAGFAPVDPQQVLGLIFKQAQERLEHRDDVRAFLTTLAPAAMSFSQTAEEIPRILSKMLSLVGSSNSLVKLESFFSEIQRSVDVKSMKGAFPIILELLQSGFFPTTELVEEAKNSTDRSLLYQSWRGVANKIGGGEFNVSDVIHVALHYTAFRHRVDKSRLLDLLSHKVHYADYKRIVEKRQTGRKGADREKKLKEVAGQLNQFITNLRGKDWVLVSPWLTRRLSETFGQQDASFDSLFSIDKSGIWIVRSFSALEEKIPEDISHADESEDLVEESAEVQNNDQG